MNPILQVLQSTNELLTMDDLLKLSKLSTTRQVKAYVKEIADKVDYDGYFYKLKATALQPVNQDKPVVPKRKPYSPNTVKGFHAKNGNITVFLDRINHAKSITLSQSDLQMLLNAVG